MKNFTDKFLKIFIIFLVILAWVFGGWPKIWNFPPEIQEAQAALSYVGGVTCSRAGSTGSNLTCNLTTLTGGSNSSPSQNDIVIAAVSTGSTVDRSIGVVNPADYTEIIELYSNGSNYDTNLSVSWKVMGALPDDSVVFGPSGNNADAISAVVHVWRGVDTASPFDATYATSTGTGTGQPDPPQISPQTAGAIIIAIGASAALTGANYTTTELSNFITITSADTNDSMTGEGSYAWTSGPFNPAQFGGGSTGSGNSWAAVTLALKPGVSAYNQAAYRWFQNNDGTQIGSVLTASQDASTTIAVGSQFRLRLLLDVSGANATAGADNFKLQFATSTPNGCDTSFSGETYVDVNASTSSIRYYNNSPNDGALMTASSTSDPSYLGHTIVTQTYEEANNFTVTSTITSGQAGEWDFSLYDASSTVNATYCFRVVKSDGTQLTTYTKIPEITTTITTVSCSTNISSTSFGVLTENSVSTSTPNASTTMSCDGPLGCTLYIDDLGKTIPTYLPGLWNSTSSYLIPSAEILTFYATATLAAGTEGYGVRATTTATGSGGTLIIATRYNTGLANGLAGGVNDVGALELATTILASSTLAITNREIVITHKAAASSTTPMGTYNDTITYSCLGN